MTSLGALLVVGFAGGAVRAQEKGAEANRNDKTLRADQIVRDAGRLERVKSVALMPIVIQLRFDRDKGVPDPARMAARAEVAARLGIAFENSLKGSAITLAAPEEVALSLKNLALQATDLYVTTVRGSWDTPAETLRNKKGDEASLLSTREEMKQTPTALTLFRFRWHDLPDTAFGLAAFAPNAEARIDLAKARAVAAKLGSDALLYCQVGDMDVQERAGLLTPHKSTRIHIIATLILPGDGAVLWQARAMGVHSHTAGIFTGARAYQSETGMAIEGGMDAVKMLVDDLLRDAGKKPTP